MTTPPSPAIADFPARYARTSRFTAGSPRTITVTDDGARILFCRSRGPEDAVLCLWELDVDTGVERLVVDPATLTETDRELPPAERARRERARESASGIVSYSVDAESQSCCFALAGSLFVVDLSDGSVTAPEAGGPDGSVFDPRIDPTGRAIAYVTGGDLRVATLDDGEDRLLRSSDDPLVSHGRAEFVAGEEMGRTSGFWWAPDGSALLATVVDETPVDRWWIADPAHPDRDPTPVRYPAAGTANAAVGLELVELDGSTQAIDWSDGGTYEYLADVIWQTGQAPLVVRQPRDQRRVSIAEVAIDDESPTITERAAISDDTWVELIGGTPRWCSAGLLTIEDRGDARRLVLDGAPIGPAALNVRSLVGVVGDGDPDVAAVVSVWTEPTEVQLATVPLATNDGEAIELLTDVAGVHGAVLGSSTLVVSESRPDRAGAVASVHRLDASGGGLGPALATIADHSGDPGFDAAPTFVALGPDRLESAVFLPADHDGSSPLPVLLDPYGGPHAQRVLKNNNGHLVSRWFAEHGYAVIVTDGRGTPGRGPAWERAVWGDLAAPILDDQVAALDAALDAHPFLDAKRVAIRGWSFGGFLAALAVLRAPDRFAAAIAGAPVTSWRLYDTHYTERYLGHPGEHPEHYQRSDLYLDGEDGLHIEALRRPMLLIHGLADDNVVAAHTLRFSTALLATGSPHRVLPLSGVTHMTPQEAVAENLLRLQLDFLDETVGDRSLR